MEFELLLFHHVVCHERVFGGDVNQLQKAKLVEL